MKIKALIQHHPVVTYFFLVLFISAGSFLLLVGPKLLQGGTEQPSDAEDVLFPIIDLGVLLVGLALTGLLDGSKGLRDLFSRLSRVRVDVRWYAVALLTPPLLFLIALLILRTLVSAVFTPKFFALGILFGLPAILEEIGWMGYAYPKMQMRQSPLRAAILLGILWGLWHAPVVDYLGAAAPHGTYWLPFFLSFVAIVTATRVLIVWIYSSTTSIFLAWFMHLSMTASLVVLDPLHVSPAQETLAYWVYAVVLWIVVAVVTIRDGKHLLHQPVQTQEEGTAKTALE
ncbi:MAG: CPBP family intramembrane metalloprotease [Chloroflexi bacterium]|nr:CPBP family intramembrane metalloprotease [Chloroflexota bacterium]